MNIGKRKQIKVPEFASLRHILQKPGGISRELNLIPQQSYKLYRDFETKQASIQNQWPRMEASTPQTQQEEKGLEKGYSLREEMGTQKGQPPKEDQLRQMKESSGEQEAGQNETILFLAREEHHLQYLKGWYLGLPQYQVSPRPKKEEWEPIAPKKSLNRRLAISDFWIQKPPTFSQFSNSKLIKAK